MSPNSSNLPRQSSPMTRTSASYRSMYSRLSSRLSSTNTSSTMRSAATISRRSPCVKTGSRPFFRRFSASAETPTTRRSPRAAARSITRRWPTWKTSNVPKVITVRGMAPLSRPTGRGRESSAMTTMTTTTADPITMITSDPAADARRRTGLRRMRTLAGSLLLFAAVLYLVTLGQDGFLGFVNAGAEASMVGAIADWFAVTALFRHPLGLPVPHTALIPRRKDELGRGLEEFFGENFLQERVIRERVASATISQRVGEWLAEPAHVRRLVDEASEVAAIGLAQVRDEHVADFVTEALVPRFREEPLAPLAGTLLGEMVEDDLHHGLVDLGLDELHEWLMEHPDTFAEVLLQRAPWWTPNRLNDAVTRRVYGELVTWVAEIRADPEHRAREAFDSMLGQLAHDLQHDPDTMARTERLKERLLDHPQ